MSYNLKDTKINGIDRRIGDTIRHRNSPGYFVIENIDILYKKLKVTKVGYAVELELPFEGIDGIYYAPYVFKPIEEVEI